MAPSSLLNDALKTRNEKIFRTIEKSFSSDDEAAFTSAAEKLTKFIERKEAYYTEARPLVSSRSYSASLSVTPNVHITARATLTRLSKSPTLFQSNFPYPSWLEPRVGAYRALLATAFRHAGTFANDHALKEELKEIFASAQPGTSIPTPPSERTPGPQEGPKRAYNAPSSSSATESGQKISTPLESTSKELPQNPTRVKSGQVSTGTAAPPPTALAPQAPHPSAPMASSSRHDTGTPVAAIASPLTFLRNAVPEAGSSTSPSALSTKQLKNTRANVPVSPNLASRLSPSVLSTNAAETPPMTSSSTIIVPEKPATKPRKKPRLLKSSFVDSTLADEDMKWYSSKQKQRSVPTPLITDKERGESGASSVVSLPDVPVVNTSTISGSAEVTKVHNTPLRPKSASQARETDVLSIASTPEVIDLTIDEDIDPGVALSLASSEEDKTRDAKEPLFRAPALDHNRRLSEGQALTPELSQPQSHKISNAESTPLSPPFSGSDAPHPILIEPSSSSMSISTDSYSDPVRPESPAHATPHPASPKQSTPHPTAMVTPPVGKDHFLRPLSVGVDNSVHIESNDKHISQDVPGQEPSSRQVDTSEAVLLEQPEVDPEENDAMDMMDVDSYLTESVKPQDTETEKISLQDPPEQASSHSTLTLNTDSAAKNRELTIDKNHIYPMKSTFGPSTAVYVSVDLGETVGGSVVMDFELSQEQEALLSLWKTRGQHKRDTTNSICLSLACYRQDDAVEAGFETSGNNGETDMSTLIKLTSSWPINSRLSADIGKSRLFLAPPLLVTGEGFVDVTSHVEGRQIQIRLDHACDMTSYVFALIAHPPTPSQLKALEERRAKDAKWEALLFDLAKPFTPDEVFGPQTD
ncbi:hypothetical protein M0805_009006 [Coniferiporia weirii]|nr:hypothetical protein M0805_009006 [Coniferiporia weirii]